MIKPRAVWLVLAGLGLASAPSIAEESLARWAANIDKPETQQKILVRVHPGQFGPVSDAVLDKASGMYFFPQGSMWVRLGKDVVFSPGTSGGAAPYFVVSCMYGRGPGQEPISATTYLLRDTTQRATALSSGYAAHERVQRVTLPKLGRSFLLLTGSSLDGSSGHQWTAALLEITAAGLSDRPRTVWANPRASWNFQFGFDGLGGPVEELVLRTLPRNNEDFRYSAYRWTGDRFELDGFASESRLKALPDDVWQYGAGQ